MAKKSEIIDEITARARRDSWVKSLAGSEKMFNFAEKVI